LLPLGSGLVESPKAVLKQGTGIHTRNPAMFRELAGLFWSTAPQKAATPRPVPQAVGPRCAGEAPWRRALAPRERHRMVSSGDVTHPLRKQHVDHKPKSVCDVMGVIELPDVDGPTAWDAVDEAVHKAFIDGSTANPRIKLNLAELVSDTRELAGPELPGGEMHRGLPPAPCRGLARMECLIPRPFYLPLDEEPAVSRPTTPIYRERSAAADWDSSSEQVEDQNTMEEPEAEVSCEENDNDQAESGYAAAGMSDLTDSTSPRVDPEEAVGMSDLTESISPPVEPEEAQAASTGNGILAKNISPQAEPVESQAISFAEEGGSQAISVAEEGGQASRTKPEEASS